MKINTIIMAGGKGERFWPQSTSAFPKQFSAIISEKTMLEETFNRHVHISGHDSIYISTGRHYRHLVEKLFPAMPREKIICEPCGRDTAAAVLFSVMSAPGSENDMFLFVPADHYINGLEQYTEDVHDAAAAAQRLNKIVLIGIKPTLPSPNYGYIHTDNSDLSSEKIQHILEFKEKPSCEVAEKWLAGGGYYWNSGMFIFSRKVLMKAFIEYSPAHINLLNDYFSAVSGNNLHADTIFAKIPSISFDYAVLEKCSGNFCLPASFVWDDVGSWNALPRILGKDKKNNCIKGAACVWNSENVTVSGQEDVFIVVNGVSGINIIKNGKFFYVCNKNNESDIKKILPLLREGAFGLDNSEI